MFNKVLVATAILAASSSIALASVSSAPYIGGSVGLINNTSDANSPYRGINANISIGYGAIVSPAVYLGGELFAVPGSFNVSGTGLLKSTWGVGGSIIPGFYFSDRTMVYTRLGVVGTHFTTGGGRTRAGGQLGLGMQTNVCQNWDVRGEYVWSKYGSFNGISSPNTDGFNFGLVYKLD